MKRAAISMIVFLFGTALASAAFAQGRHDEKPHGSSKPSVSATDTQYEPMSGGRHDEKPHGPRKPVAKKSDSNKSDGKKSQQPESK